MTKSKSDFSAKPNNDFGGIKSAYPELSANLRNEYPEIDDIRDDLGSLKKDVVSLGKHVKSNGGKHAGEVKHYAEDQIEKVRKAGVDALHKIEARATEKPGQTIALAFVAGLAASFLLGKRR